MKITIISIRAEIIDVSTPVENDFIISKWFVEYKIDKISVAHHIIRGEMEWNKTPVISEILEGLKIFYE